MIPQTPPDPGASVPTGVVERVEALRDHVDSLGATVNEIADLVGLGAKPVVSRLEVLHGYIAIFVIAFLVTLIATPIMRRLALANGIVDRPSEARKLHRIPVAYLGGAAVFLGILAGILYSYLALAFDGWITFHPSQHVDADGFPAIVPFSVLLGLFVIMLVGLLDDVVGILPHIKIGGQLVAAAALASQDVGVKVAAGVVVPMAKAVGIPVSLRDGFETIFFQIPLPMEIPLLGASIPVDLVYWTGTAIIAIFVLGACNASNLIDGLDGLCSGVHAIAAAGLLVVALTLAALDDGERDTQRIILCLALLGACLGFLPHNYRPATIFLGDCGSLLLGYCTIVIILMLGDRGFTHLVFAGLVIYSIPIIDTVLAIVRRKMSGKRISDADDQHLHHMLKRSMGVQGAVLTLYGLGIGLAVLGVAMSLWRARAVYAAAMVFLAFIIVTAFKMARKKQLEDHAMSHAVGATDGGETAGGSPAPDAPARPGILRP